MATQRHDDRPAPTRVLWVVKGLGRGGAEHLLVQAAAHIDRRRFHVEVAYLLDWKDLVVGDLRDLGVAAHSLGATRTLDPRWALRLRRLVRRGRFDIVHTHSPVPAVAARLALGPRRPAIVHTEHNEWSRFHPVTRWVNAHTYGRNDAVIAVSAGVADSIAPRGITLGAPPVPEVVIHGVDAPAAHAGPEARRVGRVRLGLADDDLVVGTVANFTPKKDQSTLLAAVERLRPTHPRLRLVLIGEGPLEQALRDESCRRGLDGVTLFTGSRGDVRELLPAFDVFVLSSRHEGLPIALLEAMAAHLACVSTRVGGTPEALGDGEFGALVPPGRPDDLADAIAAYLDDPAAARAVGDRAARKVLDFSATAAVERIEEIYTEVLETRATRGT